MTLPGWTITCGSCLKGEHMCGGDCDCDDVSCLKRRFQRQDVDFHTEVERIKGTPDTLGLLLEGNCPVHRTELRREMDGLGYCDRCAAEMGAVAVGYRVLSSWDAP